jgi:TonB family protein
LWRGGLALAAAAWFIGPAGVAVARAQVPAPQPVPSSTLAAAVEHSRASLAAWQATRLGGSRADTAGSVRAAQAGDELTLPLFGAEGAYDKDHHVFLIDVTGAPGALSVGRSPANMVAVNVNARRREAVICRLPETALAAGHSPFTPAFGLLLRFTWPTTDPVTGVDVLDAGNPHLLVVQDGETGATSDVIDVALDSCDSPRPPRRVSKPMFAWSPLGARLQRPQPAGATVTPRLVKEAKPVYPQAALSAKISGTVTLACLVSSVGLVGQCDIVKSLDPVRGVDASAMESALAWRFDPATVGGKPIPWLVFIDLEFNAK